MKVPSIIFISGLALIVSCKGISREDLTGTYVSAGYTHTSDTITLLPNGSISRRIKSKHDSKFWSMTGQWSLGRDGFIAFRSFFVNLDANLGKFPEQIADSLGGWAGRPEWLGNQLRFCIGHYDGQYCYEKISLKE
jgi:hypothetical protein